MNFSKLFLSALLFSLTAANANDLLSNQQRIETTSAKKNLYVESGFFAGGNKSIKKTTLQGIRRSLSPEGFERIVLDLKSENSELPYFEIRLDSENQRFTVNLWTELKADSAEKLSRALAKSKFIKELKTVSALQPETAVLEFQLSKKAKLEAFYLTGPSRLIIDLL